MACWLPNWEVHRQIDGHTDARRRFLAQHEYGDVITTHLRTDRPAALRVVVGCTRDRIGLLREVCDALGNAGRERFTLGDPAAISISLSTKFPLLPDPAAFGQAIVGEYLSLIAVSCCRSDSKVTS